ncbi:hypothetical protein M3193_02135 [Sporosarcina luteola]|uniref:hypothetical protein n=1 Tax=Sporosarcina luteola TaxID=582850 RepID=UPI0020402A0C|nr:hypothetical protein [Sporosarcina luteola]MCM3742931.1 hypothetical protein [Sporosarcina luteola]
MESKLTKMRMLDAAHRSFDKKDELLLMSIDDCEYDESSRNVALIDYINKGYQADEICLEDSLSEVSRKVVHFIFRNGIVEDMHAGKFSVHKYEEIPKGTPIEIISQLSDPDMMALNKYMMDRVGYLLKLLQSSDYTKLHYVLNEHDDEDANWDMPNTHEVENEINELICKEMEFHLKHK